MPKNIESTLYEELSEGRESIQTPKEARETRGQYKKTIEFFESYARDFSQQLEKLRKAGDQGVIADLEKGKRECEVILRSLEVGDTKPAFNKISAMIEQNLATMREGMGVPEERIKIIRELTDYLAELQDIKTESQESYHSEGEAEQEEDLEVLPPEQKMAKLKKEIAEKEAEKERLGQVLEKEEKKLKKIRSNLGLSSSKTDSHNILDIKEGLKALDSEIETLEKQM